MSPCVTFCTLPKLGRPTIIPGGGNRTRTGISAQRILSLSQNSRNQQTHQPVTDSDEQSLPASLPLKPEIDPDWEAMKAVWNDVPKALRPGIRAMVEAAAGR